MSGDCCHSNQQYSLCATEILCSNGKTEYNIKRFFFLSCVSKTQNEDNKALFLKQIRSTDKLKHPNSLIMSVKCEVNFNLAEDGCMSISKGTVEVLGCEQAWRQAVHTEAFGVQKWVR